ncbi:MAG: UbiD family decarboxylase [Bacteroidota bacterium]|nr:UbiD family decarboxylase [Bacteroidota bacterium]
MSYRNLRECVDDLEKRGELIRLNEPIDPNLDLAELHRRIYERKGPAILFTNIVGSAFPSVSNLFGTIERTEYIFKDCLRKMEALINLKINPMEIVKSPLKSLNTIPFALKGLPVKKYFKPAVLENQSQVNKLPLIRSWPKDGGAFITLPQVISFPPQSQALKDANVGMYRIQLNGNQYKLNEEVGLHYQLHRGIGNHHTLYKESKQEFKLSIGVGGPPAYTLASIFPLPESLSEILFSGLLGNRSYRYCWKDGFFIPTEVDFCITGVLEPGVLKPEGPFGDHLGYYSLEHPFPVLNIKNVYHRNNPIWHFTVVGRPPQEDSSFGHIIHQMVKNLSENEFPGIKEIHAVDASGVHPLLLAIGSERYMPFREKKPEEILTLANHLLGKGQTSLAKYLIIAAKDDTVNLSTKNIREFLAYTLMRVDWRMDLHFYTQTTIDTLDYSGDSWNSGSKLVIACHRGIQRTLGTGIPALLDQSSLVTEIKIIQPGILIFGCASFKNYPTAQTEIQTLSEHLASKDLSQYPLIILVDDATFSTADYNNFLWVTFTRSNPSHDIYGVNSFTHFKHWGCNGSLIIDARMKPHHAPVLEPDPDSVKRIDQMILRNDTLKKYLE